MSQVLHLHAGLESPAVLRSCWQRPLTAAGLVDQGLLLHEGVRPFRRRGQHNFASMPVRLVFDACDHVHARMATCLLED